MKEKQAKNFPLVPILSIPIQFFNSSCKTGQTIVTFDDKELIRVDIYEMLLCVGYFTCTILLNHHNLSTK